MFSITENEKTYTDEYIIESPIYPPSHNNKGLSTRISPPSSPPASYEASISATFDDVYINGTGIPLDGSWLVNITGLVKGGAILDCFSNTFSGYGFADEAPFKIQGDYVVDSLGNINGSFTVYDWSSGDVDDSGTITGVVDSKVTKISLTIRSVDMGSGSVKMAGTPAPADPVVPRDWTVKVSPGGGIFDTFTITQPDAAYPRVFEMHGDMSGEVTAEVSGGFFLGAMNKVYGEYSVVGEDNVGEFQEKGLLSGTITLSPKAKFKMTAVSDPDEKGRRSSATLKGTAK
jgi:hypothetical protein